MTRFVRSFPLLAAAVLAVLSAWPSAHAADLRPFKFATWGNKPTGAADMFYGLPAEKGWFKEVGIDFQMLRMVPNVAFPGIAAGEVDGTASAGSAPIAALRGAPLVVVFYDHTSAPWSLVVDPKKIKTPKDYAGARCVATTGAKTAPHVAAAAMIDKLGGDPQAFQSIGIGQPPPFYIQALRAGTADCMVALDGAWANQAAREGYKIAAYLPRVKLMPTNGLAVAPAALKDPAKRALVADVVGVFLRTHAYVRDPRNRAELVATLERWMGSPKDLKREDYEAAITELAEVLPPKGYIDDKNVLAGQLITGVQYGIYDPKEFKVDPRTADLIEAGALDLGLIREVVGRGGPLYRAK
jgi:hypothetical protein